MKPKEIQELIDYIANTGLEEVNIETSDFKIRVKRNMEGKTTFVEKQSVVSPQQPIIDQPQSVPTSEKKIKDAEAIENKNYKEIKSPMIGTFYRSATPESGPFVKVGDKVTLGQTVCIVEAMKLFNEIESDIEGTVVKVLVDNSQPVEYDQPLFLIDPS
ncbi:MAG TPA: acetyl-CoA carboxylase biotin carboxyl carrier protein [Cyclobacteriaceae bacterium]